VVAAVLGGPPSSRRGCAALPNSCFGAGVGYRIALAATVALMPDLWTEDPRLAAVYDTECAGRDDHDFYLALADELGAETVVDVGCGTGVFAVDLARRGHAVIGLDPAGPMLDIARERSGGLDIEWIHGVATDVASGVADLVVMMGHVAQYFVDDVAWSQALGQVHRILKPGGRLAFETRNPAIPWEQHWTEAQTAATMPHPGGGEFTSWVEVVEKSGHADSYTLTHHGHTILPSGLHLTATESLRFRSPAEVVESLETAGFFLEQTWGGWDRSPFTSRELEMIVVAGRD